MPGENARRHRLAIARWLVTLLAGTILVSGVVAVGASISAGDLGGGDEPILLVQDIPSPPPRLAIGTASSVSNSSWTTVNLGYEYDSMVVIASPNYDASSPPLVTRVRNAAGSSFEVRVDRADGSGSGVSGVDVHFLVMESGVFTQAADGVKMEAVRYTSTVTDNSGSWLGQPRSYSNSYTDPVVLGQVMTYNDGDFSVFWARGATRTTPPSSTTLFTGKHVGEDPDTTRANEVVGYIVLEAGSGSIEGVGYVAGVGSDTVQGVDDSPPYAYSLSGLASASVALVSSAAMDSSNGGWPVLYGASPVTTSNLNLSIDEDQLGDSERGHPTEQVAYLVFE